MIALCTLYMLPLYSYFNSKVQLISQDQLIQYRFRKTPTAMYMFVCLCLFKMSFWCWQTKNDKGIYNKSLLIWLEMPRRWMCFGIIPSAEVTSSQRRDASLVDGINLRSQNTNYGRNRKVELGTEVCWKLENKWKLCF